MKNKVIAKGKVCSIAAIIAIVLDTGSLRTNQRGLELIGNAEGCRRDPYRCPAGILTDGVGNTHGVQVGVRKTDAQIAADWQQNIREAEQCVNRYANGAHLPENTFAAAVEITFQMGCPKMQSSTLYRLLRQGDYIAACHQLPRWVYVQGHVIKGLVRRRAESQALCLDGLP